MFDLIGLPVEIAEKKIKEKGLNYQIINNNYNVNGDHILVTNVSVKNNQINLIVGHFIFNLGNKNKN